MEHLYRKGVGGLYVTGSTGEGIYLDFEIRQQIVEIAVRLSKGRGNVIVHVGAVQAAQGDRAGRSCRPGRRRRGQQHSAVCRRLLLGRSASFL